MIFNQKTKSFKYLNNVASTEAENDIKKFGYLMAAFKTLKISEMETELIFQILATILHLGNIIFIEKANEGSEITNLEPIEFISTLLGCKPGKKENSI